MKCDQLFSAPVGGAIAECQINKINKFVSCDVTSREL